MAKKKKVAAKGRKKPTKKKSKTKGPAKGASSKRTATKKTTKKTGKKSVAKKKPAAPQKKKAARKKPAPRKKKVSLGRPKVTGEEKLYLLFKEDFHARQIFAFLQVETVRELEEYSAQEIVKRVSQPIRQTVGRVRQKLADHNRCLLDDEEFALRHKAQKKL